MKSKSRASLRFGLAALTVLALLFSTVPSLSAKGGGDDGGGGGGGGEDGPLKLRINDAIGKPGGSVALVLRTYASRPIRQGQITIKVRKSPPRGAATAPALTFAELTQPVRPLTLVRVVVFSQRNDSVSRATLNGAPDSQSVRVDFSSASGSVNAADGPLAVFFLRLDPSAAPGQRYNVEVDPAVTGLTDAAGQPIVVEPINAVLTVRAASAPLAVEAEGDEVAPGEMAELGVQTSEPFGISRGRIALRYKQSAAAGPAVVTMDPRYGKATFQVDRSKPGLLVVTFQSKNAALNTVPGTIVGIGLPTRASAQIGTQSSLSLDPAGTWMYDRQGKKKLRLRLEGGVLAFR